MKKTDKICSDCSEFHVLIDLKTGKKVETVEFPLENPVVIKRGGYGREEGEDVKKELSEGHAYMVFKKYYPKDDIWFVEPASDSLETKTDFTLKELKRICELLRII
jgi:hypothetical protein